VTASSRNRRRSAFFLRESFGRENPVIRPAQLPALFLLAALGCASSLAPRGDCPSSIEETLDDPKLLRAAADQALKQDDPELAFRYLALLETLHPGSPDSRELYPAAAKLYQRAYYRNRIPNPKASWMHYDHAVMYFWLSQFFESPDRFPQEQVDLLLVGMPYNVFEEFTAYAEVRPRLFQFWGFEATADDGKVETVKGIPGPPR
jgi:hypothetical protein